MNTHTHTPVLLQEILENLPTDRLKNIIDCTLGLGGHLLSIAQKSDPKMNILAFDQDENNLKLAQERLKKYKKGIHFIPSNFENLTKNAKKYNFNNADFILYDLGVSSPHLDEAQKGFSFKNNGPLDMRLDQRNQLTAADILNNYDLLSLTKIFTKYGEIKKGYYLSQSIIQQRQLRQYKNTFDLVAVIKEFSSIQKYSKLVTTVFQALRIAVNRELEVLEESLPQALELLRTGGRIAVISYHSLEDRITKRFAQYWSTTCHCDKKSPICTCKFKPQLKIINKKIIVPSPLEIEKNPRSRSAKLRIMEKV